MLFFKQRRCFALVATGAVFALYLSSCFSGGDNGIAPTGTPSSTAGQASIASAGTTATSSGAPGISGGGGTPGVSGASSTSGAGGMSASGGSAVVTPPCTDNQHPDHMSEACSIWVEWDKQKGASEPKDCDASWLTGAGYCLESCGKGKAGSGSGGSSNGSGGSSSGSSGSGNGSGGYSTGLGPGPNLPNVTSGTVHWASRYWDCCKPHCATNGNIPSCNKDGVTNSGSGSACSG